MLTFMLSWPVCVAKASPEVVVTTSVKIWQNTWIYRPNSDGKFMGSSFLIGPSVKISMDKYFAGITYMRTSTDYDLRWRNYSMKTPREDTDVVFGYLVNSNLAVVTGYKGIRYSPQNYQDQEWESQGSNSIDAGMVGISLNKELKQNGLTLTAILSAGLYQAESEVEYKDDSDEDESEGDLLHFGVKGEIYSSQAGLTLPLSEKSFLNISYKYQILNSYAGTNMDFKGMLFSIDFVF